MSSDRSTSNRARPAVDPCRRWWADAAAPRRATYTRPHGIRHLLAAYDLNRDKLYGHIKPRKRRGEYLGYLRYLRTLYPGCGLAWCWTPNSPHLSTRDDHGSASGAQANNVELAYVPTNASWLNRIEAQFTALGYFAVDGTDHPATPSRPA